MADRKYSLTKQDLVDNGYFIEGERLFRNYYSKKRGHNIKEIKPRVMTHKLKYGKGKSYAYVKLDIKRLNNVQKRIHVGLHKVIYAWYKGEVPFEYDVDHVDNNGLNNNIDNLQLLTHRENVMR